MREAGVDNIFSECPRVPALRGDVGGAIDVKPLITRTFAFDKNVDTFKLAVSAPFSDVKMQIVLPQQQPPSR